jgi:hypothetical protein
VEALGRGQDFDKLTQYLQALAMVAPLAADPDLNTATIKIRLANAIGIDTSGLLLTPEDKARRQAEQAVGTGMDNMAATAGQGAGALATVDEGAASGAMDAAGVSL